MFAKTKPQFNRNGTSPLRHLDTNYQKENIQNNPIIPNNNLKPLISPRRNQQNERNFEGHSARAHNFTQQRSPQPTCYTDRGSGYEKNRNAQTCYNHPSKKAEFRTFSQEGAEYFCGRCAAQLATQGLEVEKLASSGTQGMKKSKRTQIPFLPQYENFPIYHEIKDILKLCNTVVQEHNFNIESFSRLDQEYNQQADLISAFYDRLIDIIEETKQDHLQDYMQEKEKYTQIADIQNDSLRENIIEVNVIKNDIENHMEEVLEGIQASGDDAECRESLEHYRQKLTLFRHQTQEQQETLSKVTRYPQAQIDSMLSSFQNFVGEMWGLQGETQQQQDAMPMRQLNSAMTVKNIHQILPRGVNNEGEKGAFRNLEAEEEQIMERKSPNFKKI